MELDMRESDRDWYQEKTDEVSGFQQSSTFDSRLPINRARPRVKRRKRTPIWPFFLVGGVLAGVAVVLAVLPRLH